jgi:Polyketide cyclase / dehydrase and lipid transport
VSDTAWAIEHSVETSATPAYAWMYMTDVKNWDDPPATFQLEGSFTSGAAGTTKLPGQEPRRWRLRDVVSHDCYTIEIALDGAVVLCKWMFAEISDGHTRLTQHITLKGEKASSYRDDVQRAFRPGLAPGMSRIATAIDQAFVRDKSSS